MKKIFLFTTIIIFSLLSKIFAQTPPFIDTAYVSVPITCFGDFTSDEIQINTIQASPAVTYSFLVGRYVPGTGGPPNGFFISQRSSSQTTGTSISLVGFPPVDNFGDTIEWYVRLVDSTSYYSTHSFGNGFGSAGVTDEFGPIIITQPEQLSVVLTSTASNLCFGDCIAAEELAITGGTLPYTYTLDANPSITLPGNVTVDTLANLCVGSYNLIVTDSNNCLINPSPINFLIAGVSVLSSGPTASTDVSCNGANDGTATVINIIGGTSFTVGDPYLYLWDDPLAQTTLTATGLSPGTYACTVTDANGCSIITSSVTITAPTSLTASTTISDVTCLGGTNGSASLVNVIGGTPFTVGDPYLYLWDDPLAQTTLTANGLAAGNYICTVTDANGCTLEVPVSINLTLGTGFTISFSTISPCLGPLSGSATVTASAPVAAYQWRDANNNVIPGENSATLDSISVGNYSVDVTDVFSCTLSASVTVTPPLNPIKFDTIIVTRSSCYGVDDSQIEIIASGGQPPYLYSIDSSSTTQSNPLFSSLAPGNYRIETYDFNGCYTDTIISVVYTDLLQVDSTYFSDITCNGANDGEILSIDVLGGTPPFTYSVNGSNHYSNMSYFYGYGPGIYSVEVEDSNNCVAADYIIITEPTELNVDITTSGWDYNSNSGLYSYQIQCNGDTSGFANLSILGGTPPYTRNMYDVNTGNLLNTISSNLFTGLSSGEYAFEVIDANECIYYETIVFNEPDSIVHNFIATHVTCTGWSNGSLIDSISGGVGNVNTYSYLWNTGDTTFNLNGVPVGNYIMTVQDENNCHSSKSFVINDNNALSSSILTWSDISCYDYCDGEISTSVLGGAPNYDANGNPVYNYQWNDILLQTTQNAVGLCVDNNTNTAQYMCVITDSQGCSDTLYQVLNQPDSLMVTSIVTSDYNLQNISCYGGNDGKVKATGNGGANPYSFAWNTQPVQTTDIATNLSAGSYSVVLTDANGCMDSSEIILTAPTEMILSVSPTNINCFGFYDGSITASVLIGSGTPFFGIPPSYNFSFSNGLNEQTDTSVAIDLAPGIYTVTATDQNGCSVTSESIFISQPTNLLTIDLDSIDESCNSNNGAVNSLVLGGTAPYNYVWSNGIFGNATSIDSLAPGIYSVVVSDANGCNVFDTIRVNGSSEVFFQERISSFDTTICLGSSFELNVVEKLGFTYIWQYNNEILLTKLVDTINNDQADILVTPTDYVNIYTLNITDPSCLNNPYEVSATINVDFIDPMPASEPGIEYGNYPVLLAGESLSLYSDNNTCVEYTWQWSEDTISNNNGLISINDIQKTDWYYLYVKDGEGCLGYDSIYVVVGVKPYDIITPNNDGFNDTWTPLDIQSYENALVQVFTRWGSLVFEAQGGAGYQAWDGTNNGKELAVGTYYYIIDLNNGDTPQTGPITIIR